MDNTLTVKEEIEITGKIESTSWHFPPFPPAVCTIKLNDVQGDIPYKRVDVIATPISCNRLMEVLQQITGGESSSILPYSPLPEESIVVRVKGRYARLINGDILEYGDTVDFDAYEIELLS